MTGRSQLALCAQIAQFCLERGRTHHAATAAHSGGSRATVATSDGYAAQLSLPDASEPNADYECMRLAG